MILIILVRTVINMNVRMVHVATAKATLNRMVVILENDTRSNSPGSLLADVRHVPGFLWEIKGFRV